MSIESISDTVKIIIKRNGTKEPFSDAKLKKYLGFITDNDEVLMNIILRDTSIKLKAETKVKVLADAVVDTCVSKISPLQTKWEFVAARAYLMNLYADAYGIKDGKKYPHLSEVLKKGVNAGIYSADILNKFSNDDLEELNSYIRPQEDLTFTYDALKQFVSKYCKGYSKNKKLELPQITYMRVAMGILYNVPHRMYFIKKLYDILTKGQATLATPIMMNSFTPLNQYSSCILNTMGNSTDDIGNKILTALLYTKGRGGLAFDVSAVQAKGTVTNNGTQASGIIPYIQDIQAAVVSMMQGDTRRGQAVITCAWWHYEIDSFLELKDASGGTPETRALLLKYAFATDKVFKEAVITNSDVTLFCPKSAPELLELSGEAFEVKYKELCLKPNLYKRTINARELFKKYLKYRFQTGNVYETMLDNINNANMTNRHIGSSNLCVVPETKILTDTGYTEIAPLVNTEVNVWNGTEFSTVTVKKTGENQEILKVITTAGELECTPYHKFYVKNQHMPYNVIEKRACDLEANDKLIKHHLPIVEGIAVLDNAYSMSMTEPTFVPNATYKISSRVEWLAGLMDIGHSNKYYGHQYTISCSNKQLLYSVVQMLHTLGVHSNIVTNTTTDYSLVISSKYYRILISLGINTYLKKFTLEDTCKYNSEENFNELVKVIEVTNEGRISDTYCFNEPKRHLGMFNGLLTGQCQEILEPSRAGTDYSETYIETNGTSRKFRREWENEEIALCNLASFNLCITDLPKEELDEIVYVVHRALDNTIDIGSYMRISGMSTNKDYRYVGLGMNNKAYWLANKGILFDSDEAEEATFLATQALTLSGLRSSTRLAREFGRFPKFHETKWAEGILPIDLGNKKLLKEFEHLLDREAIEDVRERVKNCGVRNALHFAVAPTASSATSKGLTESIEPVMELSYMLEGAVSTQVLVPGLARLRPFYQTAYNINPLRLVKLNAIRQLWIDQSQSSSIYMDTSKWSYEYLAKIHMYAWALGTKTLYYLWTPKSSSEESCASCSS